jgi:hypothetical protein
MALAAAGCVGAPQVDRDWYPYLANTSHVEDLGEGRVVLYPVSDWTYDADGPVTERYRDQVIDPGELEGVWFLLEPQPGSRIAAHTLLLFELSGDRLIGVTIEARREADETYSAWRGLWNAYELSYVWASARDLLTRRAVMLDHEIYLYPIAITDEQARTLLERLVDRTDALESGPRYYNTLTSNCTNELAKAAGIRWNRAFVLTGTADEYLFRRGLIPGASFEEANARADVTALVKTLNEAGGEGFDAALLTELRTRMDGDVAGSGAE